MIAALSILLSYQLVGEIVVRYFQLPLPGPVLGMLLLFSTLLVFKQSPKSLTNTSNALLKHFSLLFVPAGVGVIRYLGLLEQQGIALLLTLVLSTVLSLLVSAWLLSFFINRFKRNSIQS